MARPLKQQKSLTGSSRKAPTSTTPPASTSKQDVDSGMAGNLLSLQHSIGNRAVRKLIQTKLTVGPAQDRYEREADQVAHQAVSKTTPTETKIQKSDVASPLVQKITPISRNQVVLREEDSVRRKSQNSATNEASTPVGRSVERRLADNRGDGHAMGNQTRAEMESKFGVDFKGVRIHTGAEASTLTRSMNAEAFTAGKDIYLGEGKYQPDSTKGKHLLAHELTHVVQQASGMERGRAGADELGHINRKKIQRQLDFLHIKRKNAGAVKEVLRQMKITQKGSDQHSHWWAETGRTDRGQYEPQESYGLWPSAGPDAASTARPEIPGMLNAFRKATKGSKTRDPHHGDAKPDSEFQPVAEMDDNQNYDKFHENLTKEVRSYAQGTKDQWSWRSKWGANTEGFQKKLMRKFKMEEPKRRTPMLYNPKLMVSKVAQEQMENGAQFLRVQEVFEDFAEKGGGTLADMFSQGGLSASDLYAAFDVMPEEQEARADMLAALNPQISRTELLKEVQSH